MEAIRRFLGYVILDTDAVEILVVVCGLLILWIVGWAWIRRHSSSENSDEEEVEHYEI